MFRYVVASDPVEIEAPAERVWDILVDFERYGEWNPFTTRVEASLEIGSPVMLHVRLGRLKRKQPERIETVEPPHLLAWGTTMGHPVLLSALREQRVEALSETRCRYLTTDATSGLLTPLVALLFGRLIRQGFNDMAAALKTRAEAVARRLGTPTSGRHRCAGRRPAEPLANGLLIQPRRTTPGCGRLGSARGLAAARSTPERGGETQRPKPRAGTHHPTDYRSCMPFPSRIRAACFSIRAARVFDCFAAPKKRLYPRCRPGVSASKAALNSGSDSIFARSSATGTNSFFCLKSTFRPARSTSMAFLDGGPDDRFLLLDLLDAREPQLTGRLRVRSRRNEQTVWIVQAGSP